GLADRAARRRGGWPAGRGGHSPSGHRSRTRGRARVPGPRAPRRPGLARRRRPHGFDRRRAVKLPAVGRRLFARAAAITAALLAAILAALVSPRSARAGDGAATVVAVLGYHGSRLADEVKRELESS